MGGMLSNLTNLEHNVDVHNHKTKLTFGYKYIYSIWFGIGCTTCIVPCIPTCHLVDDKAAVCFRSWLSVNYNPTPTRVVVDHSLVVIPIHVLWWNWTLTEKLRIKRLFRSRNIICKGIYEFWIEPKSKN